jgi:hypothetical protein
MTKQQCRRLPPAQSPKPQPPNAATPQALEEGKPIPNELRPDEARLRKEVGFGGAGEGAAAGRRADGQWGCAGGLARN